MKFKVCILAAGVGTRMSPLTDKINKSLLPVDFKAVLSHIIEKFDIEIEIVIAVGHLKDTILEYLACAHKDRKITIVEVDQYTGKGSGPGYSLMQCKIHLDLPFIFFASDTLVIEDIPLPSKNWLGVSLVKDTENYCTAEILENRIVRLEDKIKDANKNAFIGVAGVNDHKVFFDALAKNKELKAGEFQVSNGFSALTKYDLAPEYFTWHDTGNMKGYIDANIGLDKLNSTFDFSKQDEFLYFVGDNVIKFFADENIIRNRYKRSLIIGNLCPKIDCIKRNFYSYRKIKGKVLYDVVNDNVIEELMYWLDENLWLKSDLSESKAEKFKLSCFDFYYKKTIDRVAKYHKKYDLLDQATRINDVFVPSLEKMFSFIDWGDLSAGEASNFHGDLQFDNILLTAKGDFLLLDWRQDFSGVIDYGDQYYDLAKLNGGMKVSYKLIKKGNFSYQIDKKGNVEIIHEVPPELATGREAFLNFINKNDLDVSKIDILTSLIYLNMSPMHHEPFDHFIYNLGKLSLYRSLLENGKIPA